MLSSCVLDLSVGEDAFVIRLSRISLYYVPVHGLAGPETRRLPTFPIHVKTSRCDPCRGRANVAEPSLVGVCCVRTYNVTPGSG